MSDHLENWHQVAALEEIPVRGSRRIRLSDSHIALFRTAENRVFALRDSCPHKGGPLSAGIVHDGCVTCPLHNWVISLESGEAQGADTGRTPVFPVRIVDQQVLINIASPAECPA